jgi:DNA polymerase III delta' subunit
VSALNVPKLADVCGNAGIRRLLARLRARDRLPHALLLEGLPGCGRRTLAMSLAQALLCEKPSAGDACGSCDSCRLVSSRSHPDLVCLPSDREADELPVELIRDSVVQAAYESPLLGDKRVFVVPDIDRLRGAAANALLKVLEEPPAGAYLLMTAAHSASVLATIRSRAQLFRLQPLSVVEVEAVLRRGGVSAPVAATRSILSAGSHRGLWEELSSPPLEAMLGLALNGFDSSLVADVVAALPQREPKGEDGPVRTLAGEQRRCCRQWLDALIQHMRGRLSGSEASQAADIIERVLSLQGDLRRNLSPRLVIEALALPAR